MLTSDIVSYSPLAKVWDGDKLILVIKSQAANAKVFHHQLGFRFKFMTKVRRGGKFRNKSKKFRGGRFIRHFPGYIGLNFQRLGRGRKRRRGGRDKLRAQFKWKKQNDLKQKLTSKSKGRPSKFRVDFGFLEERWF